MVLRTFTRNGTHRRPALSSNRLLTCFLSQDKSHSIIAGWKRLDLLPLARQVPLNNSRMEEWSTTWATDTLKVAPLAFAGATFAKDANGWTIAFPNHDAYVQKQDDIKRQQLAKAGARLAQILNKVWP